MRVLAMTLVFSAAACQREPVPVGLPGETPPPCALVSDFYLITSIDLPDRMDSKVMAWDLDDDGYRENRVGNRTESEEPSPPAPAPSVHTR